MSPSEAEHLLAQHCYGYGRWDAQYWFIGPEQGQSKDERDDLTRRAQAFQELQIDGLCDCRKFHEHIEFFRWYVPKGKRPIPTQSTWRSLMRVLFALKRDGAASAQILLDELRSYQLTRWGSGNRDGETCVVDLSGLPANSLNVSRPRDMFRAERLAFLHEKMKSVKPKYVVIYGASQFDHWRNYWQSKPEVQNIGEFWKLGPTKIALVSTRRGQTNAEWIELGERLRAA